MCVCMYVCMYVYIYIYMCVFLCVFMYTYTLVNGDYSSEHVTRGACNAIIGVINC